ncbi:MAG: histidinol-phosphatase [Oscillospiraceae bacterium]|nr:histidinol-phosphatase [Oscillospiraceae bacterium]
MTNFHTHTTYCDGVLSAEEMVQAAISRGLTALGFSGHSHEPSGYGMNPQATIDYMHEVTLLKEKYKGRIDIYLGIEQEYYTDRPPPPKGLDYVIGAAHILKIGEEFISVDYGVAGQLRTVEQYFNGDFYAMAEAYFETVAMLAERDFDIVAHFDLVTKYNLNGRLFDESHPRYVTAAITAMDELLKRHRLFEINTRAMYSQGKPEPYPSVFLLKELAKRGGEVILSSDSHDAESLCYKFREMEALVKSCGLRVVQQPM